MNDIVNIRLSKDANDIAERLVATGKFENVVTAAKFALAYALKNHFDECDPSTSPAHTRYFAKRIQP